MKHLFFILPAMCLLMLATGFYLARDSAVTRTIRQQVSTLLDQMHSFHPESIISIEWYNRNDDPS